MSFMWLDQGRRARHCRGADGIRSGLLDRASPVGSAFLWFDDEGFGKTLAVLIRLGALLALLSIYFLRLPRRVVRMFSDPAARRFVIGVLLTLLPASVVGAFAHALIKDCSTPGSSALH
jgi:undecaprenyl pyrophosphate phosphatase UppP